MNKFEHTADARVLVGIDISKHRHELLIAAPGKTRRRRLTITDTLDDFQRLIAILNDYARPVQIAPYRRHPGFRGSAPRRDRRYPGALDDP